MTRVVDMRRGEPYDVRIDRRTFWGNPFPIEDYRRRLGCTEQHARWLSLADYECWVRSSPDPRAVRQRERAHELHDKTLGCWCAPPGGAGPDDPLVCHGQILARLAAEAGAWLGAAAAP